MSLYKCDPKKHKKCNRRKMKGVCGEWCVLTTVSQYSVDGVPLGEAEVEAIEDQLRESVEPGLRIGAAVDWFPTTRAAEEEPDTELEPGRKEQEDDFSE